MLSHFLTFLLMDWGAFLLLFYYLFDLTVLNLAPVAHRVMHRTQRNQVVIVKFQVLVCVNRYCMVYLQVFMIIFSLCPIDFSDTYLAKVIIPLLYFSSFLLPFGTISKPYNIVCPFLFDRLLVAFIIFIVHFATIFT